MLLRSRPAVLTLGVVLLGASASLGGLIAPNALAAVDHWPSGLDKLKPLPKTAEALGDVALALWTAVAAGLILVLGDNLLGLGRLATLAVGGRYPTAAESYNELNAAIMEKTTHKYLVPPCR